MGTGTKWLVFILLISIIACDTETRETDKGSMPSATSAPTPIEATTTLKSEPTLTPTEMALVSTIEALLEDEKTSTAIPTATLEPTPTAVATPTLTPRPTRQILPSLALTAAAEPVFNNVPAIIVGRCGNPVANLIDGSGCYFDDHNSAFFVDEEYNGCIYRSDEDTTQCEPWLWQFVNFCIEKVKDEDVEWKEAYTWQIEPTCTVSPSGPTPTPVPESPVSEVMGLGHCQNDWFLHAGEGCLIRHTDLFFWVTADYEGCFLREGNQDPVCFENEVFEVLRVEETTIPILFRRTTKFQEGEGWQLESVEPPY